MNPTISLIEQRVSVNLFDASHELTDPEILQLVQLATRAPIAYNLQNWRFIAVRGAESKSRRRSLAYNQAKVLDAAVTVGRAAPGNRPRKPRRPLAEVLEIV